MTLMRQVLRDTGICLDYVAEIVAYNFFFKSGGIEDLTRALVKTPMKTYMEVKELRLAQRDPSWVEGVEKAYTVTSQNRGTIEKMDRTVALYNKAANEKRLTNRMHERFYGRLLTLMRGREK